MASPATDSLALAWALHFLWLSPTTSSALAYAVCIPLGYIGQRSITFRSSRPRGIALTAYLAVQGIAVLIVTAVTLVSAEVLRHPPVLTGQHSAMKSVTMLGAKKPQHF
jgi:putative flippase GtrA